MKIKIVGRKVHVKISSCSKLMLCRPTGDCQQSAWSINDIITDKYYLLLYLLINIRKHIKIGGVQILLSLTKVRYVDVKKPIHEAL